MTVARLVAVIAVALLVLYAVMLGYVMQPPFARHLGEGVLARPRLLPAGLVDVTQVAAIA